MHPVWRALLQNIELMPQNQDFSFEPPARLEAVAQHADDQKGNCHHRPRSCSDSVMAATPADGVFGSDMEIGVSDRANVITIAPDVLHSPDGEEPRKQKAARRRPPLLILARA